MWCKESEIFRKSWEFAWRWGKRSFWSWWTVLAKALRQKGTLHARPSKGARETTVASPHRALRFESPLDCKEIQPVHSEDQPWGFFGRNDAKAETPVLWPPHAKSWLIGKDSDAGRDWGQEEKGATEDEMAWWHHWLDGHWVSVNSRSWWWTGRPGVLRFMGLQRVRHNWATELNECIKPPFWDVSARASE